jgi:hypothetical protein
MKRLTDALCSEVRATRIEEEEEGPMTTIIKTLPLESLTSTWYSDNMEETNNTKGHYLFNDYFGT